MDETDGPLFVWRTGAEPQFIACLVAAAEVVKAARAVAADSPGYPLGEAWDEQPGEHIRAMRDALARLDAARKA